MDTITHQGHIGDVIAVDGHHVGDVPKLGEILEILGQVERPHYRVRWEDGRESIFYPGSDAVVRPKRTARKRRATAAPAKGAPT